MQRKTIHGNDISFVNPKNYGKNKEIKSWKFNKDGTILVYDLYDSKKKLNERRFKTLNRLKYNEVLRNITNDDFKFVFNGTGIVYSNKNGKNYSLYYHKLGTNQNNDVKFSDEQFNNAKQEIEYVSFDGKYLFIAIYLNPSAKSIYYCDLSDKTGEGIKKKLQFKVLIENEFGSRYDIIDANKNDVYLYTDNDSDFGGIVKLNVKKEKNFTISNVVKPKNGTLIDKVVPVGENYLVYTGYVKLQHYVFIFNKINKKNYKITNLGTGIIKNLYGNRNSYEVFFTFANPVVPTIIYTLNLKTLSKNQFFYLEKVIKTGPKNYSKSNIRGIVVHLNSVDNVSIPALIVLPGDIHLNGNNPLILETYSESEGSTSTISNFSPSRYFFVKHMKGIVCYVNTRGGVYNGDEWFYNGTIDKQQHRYDDFLTYIKFLIYKNITSPKKLAIYGSGTSGVVTAYIINNHPELVQSSIIQGTLLDLISPLNYDGLKEYKEEFGDPEYGDEFQYLKRYSPLHNIKQPNNFIQWPSTLVKTSNNVNDSISLSILKYMSELYTNLESIREYQTNPVIASLINENDKKEDRFLNDTINEMVFIVETLNLTLTI
uniref:Prolyl endopeptidase n=1 Tax=Parastrongyloides trichosuri TaxID=131310 RepID=A0A0N4Z868_PARTI